MKKSFILLSGLVAVFVFAGCSRAPNPQEAAPGHPFNAPPTAQPSPQPSPLASPPATAEIDPATVAPQIPASWSEVRYAFCSAQGRYGVLIDFLGQDLSKFQAASFLISERPCDGSQPYTWSAPKTYTVVTNGTSIKYDFGVSGDADAEDTLDTTTTSGFSDTDGNYGVFGGNSGPCVFLKNKGTQGLFDSNPMFSCK